MSTDTVWASPVTADNFARYGKVYDLMDDQDRQVIWTTGDGWRDGFTRIPLVDGSPRLGLTRAPGAPWSCAAMERHLLTEEAIFCAGEAIVLAVAPASSADAPVATDIEAFVITPGKAVVMHRGVWHDACRGAAGPTPYYWMAVCGLGESPWVPVERGSRRVQVMQGEVA